MTDFFQLIQELCSSLDIPAEPESDLLVVETQGHQAVVSSCPHPDSIEGVRVQIRVDTLPLTEDGSLVDTLRLLHHLNHQARTMTPWRIVLDDENVLLIQQIGLLSIGGQGVQQMLIDGLERVEQLETMLRDWLPEPEAEHPPLPAGPGASVMFA
jgi:hypothetical protein